jgi:hypothetical protein
MAERTPVYLWSAAIFFAQCLELIRTDARIPLPDHPVGAPKLCSTITAPALGEFNCGVILTGFKVPDGLHVPGFRVPA